MEELNNSLFLMINASSQPSSGMLVLAMALAQWLLYGVPLLLAGLWFWGKREARTAVLAAMLSIVFALGCNVLIGIIWPHPRPFMIDLGHTFLAHKPTTSFPSDHAVIFFTLGLAFIWSSLRSAGVMIMLLGIGVGWARVYLGVHFPFDIAGGLLVALFCSWVVTQVLSFRSFGTHLLDGLESLYRRVFALSISKGWTNH